jgi:hypothetical protein
MIVVPKALYCGRRAFEVWRQQAREDFIFGEVGRPVADSEDDGVEAVVGQVEPGDAVNRMSFAESRST